MFKTRVTELLGIKHPIIQGGMQHLGVPELAAAVSNAGGLGIINISIYPTPDEFRDAVRKTQKFTKKPFGVNISLLPSLNKGDEIFKYIQVCIEENVEVIETAGASPAVLIPKIKQGQIKWIHKVPSVKHAIKAEQLGVDIITIVGIECGGHPGGDEIGSLVLTNKVARAVKIPVLAAGGIADGRAMAAALSLGAEGVVMGTRFVASKECIISDNHKKWIVEASENDTMIVQRSINNIARTAKTAKAYECLELEAKGVSLQELLAKASGGVRQKVAYTDGNVESSLFHVGNAVGLINEILSCEEIISNTVSEAEAVVKRLNSLLNEEE